MQFNLNLFLNILIVIFTCLHTSSIKSPELNFNLSLLTAADKFKHFDCS